MTRGKLRMIKNTIQPNITRNTETEQTWYRQYGTDNKLPFATETRTSLTF